MAGQLRRVSVSTDRIVDDGCSALVDATVHFEVIATNS